MMGETAALKSVAQIAEDRGTDVAIGTVVVEVSCD